MHTVLVGMADLKKQMAPSCTKNCPRSFSQKWKNLKQSGSVLGIRSKRAIQGPLQPVAKNKSMDKKADDRPPHNKMISCQYEKNLLTKAHNKKPTSLFGVLRKQAALAQNLRTVKLTRQIGIVRGNHHRHVFFAH